MEVPQWGPGAEPLMGVSWGEAMPMARQDWGWGHVTPMARLVLLQASTADSQQTRACHEHASLCGSPECSTEVPVVRREIHMPDIDKTTVHVDGPAAC